jgi:hypothetical protein
MKAPLTARAWTDHCHEAAKAGWTPLQAAEKVMAKSWRGFEAKYVADERSPASGETAYQRSVRERVEEMAPGVARKVKKQPTEVIDGVTRLVG